MIGFNVSVSYCTHHHIVIAPMTRYSRNLVAVVIIGSVVAIGSVVVCVVVTHDAAAAVMSGCVVELVETEKSEKSNLKS